MHFKMFQVKLQASREGIEIFFCNHPYSVASVLEQLATDIRPKQIENTIAASFNQCHEGTKVLHRPFRRHF
jgi:hypothetical protein